MTAARDPLEGFRGGPSDERVDSPDQEYRVLVNTYYLGRSVDKLRNGLASLDDVQGIARALTEELEGELRQASQELLSLDDLNTPEARALHFKARVCGGIMQKLNSYVQAAKLAELKLRETQDGRG